MLDEMQNKLDWLISEIYECNDQLKYLGDEALCVVQRMVNEYGEESESLKKIHNIALRACNGTMVQ